MRITFVAPDSRATDLPGAWVVAAGDAASLQPAARRADKAAGGALSRALKGSAFKGKRGEFLDIVAPAGVKASRILLVGLGTPADMGTKEAEALGAKIAAHLLAVRETQAVLQVELPAKGARLGSAALAAHLALGVQLASYGFDKYRTRNLEEHRKSLKTVRVAASDLATARKLHGELAAVADGVFLARDLVNEPPNILYPVEFARRARTILAKLGVKVEVLDKAQMQRLGFGALLGVGQGSARESRLVVMRWDGVPKNVKGAARARPVAFVGKGVCFDSGGLSLKPGKSMIGMKGDMAGAAAVTGTMMALATRKARVDAVGVVGLVENMPDGNAIRPDDVLTSLSGQTIEVLNTDAEGRLVLADALTYTQRRFRPRAVIDLATLTGAIVQALGSAYAGFFSNDDRLSGQLVDAGQGTGERVWRMPLDPFYDKMLNSKIADVKNIGGTNSGAITAAQFLGRFIEKDTVWAHLDIAGVAWADGERKPTMPSWGTGWGVMLLNHLVREHFES